MGRRDRAGPSEKVTVMESRITAALAVEFWKLLRAFERAGERLPREQTARAAAQARFSASRLEGLLREAGLSLVHLDGREFEPSLPATAINIEDFEGAENLLVDMTVEPAVVQGMQVILMGKVLLKREEGAHDVSRD